MKNAFKFFNSHFSDKFICMCFATNKEPYWLALRKKNNVYNV